MAKTVTKAPAKAPATKPATKAVAAKTPTSPKNEIAVRGEVLPSTREELSAFDTGDTGYENVTARDLLIPRLTILQGLSPQVTKGQPEYDEDAKVGEIYDVGLQQRFADGLIFIPVYYVKSWLEWAPRNSGKGLQGIHETDEVLKHTEKDDKNREVLPNGNYIAETAQIYGLNVTADFRKSFIPMSSTQLKKCRRLLTLATSEKVERADGSTFTPPLFYRSYAFTTVPESNNEGNWMGWKIERGDALTEFARWRDILNEIHEFRAQLASGTIRGDVASMEREVQSSGSSSENDPM